MSIDLNLSTARKRGGYWHCRFADGTQEDRSTSIFGGGTRGTEQRAFRAAMAAGQALIKARDLVPLEAVLDQIRSAPPKAGGAPQIEMSDLIEVENGMDLQPLFYGRLLARIYAEKQVDVDPEFLLRFDCSDKQPSFFRLSNPIPFEVIAAGECLIGRSPRTSHSIQALTMVNYRTVRCLERPKTWIKVGIARHMLRALEALQLRPPAGFASFPEFVTAYVEKELL